MSMGDSSVNYGRFARRTVNTNTLIARIQKRKAGTNELALQQSAGFIKEEILEALAAGEAVNILDTGTMYIALNGKISNGSIDSGDKQQFIVKFTPSKLAQAAVADLGVAEMTQSDTSPVISSVTDDFTQSTDGTLSAGKLVILSGERLKIAGEGSGLYLCPLTSKEAPVEDESKWISCSVITKNLPRTVAFYVPEEAESGVPYKILLRTYSIGTSSYTGKTVKEAVSGVVTISA